MYPAIGGDKNDVLLSSPNLIATINTSIDTDTVVEETPGFTVMTPAPDDEVEVTC